MKLVNKTYILLAIAIGLALSNLSIIYLLDDDIQQESRPIIYTNDLKVRISTTESYANSISAGNENDKTRRFLPLPMPIASVYRRR